MAEWQAAAGLFSQGALKTTKEHAFFGSYVFSYSELHATFFDY